MDNRKIIGQRLNSALALRNKKQKELAAAINVTDNTISYFCNGSRTPNLQQLVAIAKVLDVPTDYLLGITKPENFSKDDKVSSVCEYTGLSVKAAEKLHEISTENRKNAHSDLISLMIENRNAEHLLALIGQRISYVRDRSKKRSDDEIVRDMIDRTLDIDFDNFRITAYKDSLIDSLLQTEFINFLSTVYDEYTQKHGKTPAQRKKEYRDYEVSAFERWKSGEITEQQFRNMLKDWLEGSVE